MIPFNLWLDAAKSLPVGRKGRVPSCCGNGTGTSMMISHTNKEYSAHCFVCHSNGYFDKGDCPISVLRQQKADDAFQLECKLPFDFTQDIPVQGRVWLARGGCHIATAVAYGIGWSESKQRVIIPVYMNRTLVFMQGRDCTGTSKMKYLNVNGIPKEEILWQSNKALVDTETLQDVLVITEDVLSAIAVGRVCRSVSILGTSLSLSQQGNLLNLSPKAVIVWLDGDKAGVNGSKKIVTQLSLCGIPVLRIFSTSDPKTYSKDEIKLKLEAAYEKIIKKH